MKTKLNIIKWNEFQKGIAPLWKSTNPKTIPIFNNPYDIIQYDKSKWKDIIYFPCEYVVDNIRLVIGIIIKKLHTNDIKVNNSFHSHI